MNNNKLSVEQEEEIIQLYVSGSPVKEIMSAYGMGSSTSTLYGILRDGNIPLRATGKLPASNKRDRHVAFKRAIPEEVLKAFRSPADQKREEANDIDESLPVVDSGKRKYRVSLRVRLTLESDTLEGAVVKAKGYNGFQEVLSVTRVG